MAKISQGAYAKKRGFSRPYVSKKVSQGIIKQTKNGIDEKQADQALAATRHLSQPQARKGTETRKKQPAKLLSFIEAQTKKENYVDMARPNFLPCFNHDFQLIVRHFIIRIHPVDQCALCMFIPSL